MSVEEALPPAGTITGLGRFTVTPSGAGPLQAAVKLTEELNPSTDERTIVADCDSPDVRVNAAGEGWIVEAIEKSGTATGARTDGVPAMVTIISVE